MRAFWTFADTGNAEGMMDKGPCYLALPDGRFLHEKSYAGYGIFDGFDVFELAVWWNRKYLAEHPEHVILNLERSDGIQGKRPIKDCWWYPAIGDMSLNEIGVFRRLDELKPDWDRRRTLRVVGMDIAGRAENASKLAHPIKVTKSTVKRYWELPASRRIPR